MGKPLRIAKEKVKTIGQNKSKRIQNLLEVPVQAVELFPRSDSYKGIYIFQVQGLPKGQG